MNKKILLLISLIMPGCCSNLCAQFTFVGASVNYGTWIKEFGASVYSIYSVNKRIDIVPNGTYFWPHEEIIDEPLDTGTVNYTWWSINLDGHYVLIEKSVFHVYGLMGMNFTNESKIEDFETQGQPFKIKTKTTKLGLNVGAGVQFHLSKFFIPFTEFKYTLGERHQGVISLGVLFRIAPDRIKEED